MKSSLSAGNADEAKFEKWARLAPDCAARATPFQSPTFRAVTVAPAEAPGDDVRVIDLKIFDHTGTAFEMATRPARDGTEVAFEKDIEFEGGLRFFLNWKRSKRTGETVTRFRQFHKDKSHVHHDALEFPNGEFVLLTRLCEEQFATVLQLPAGRECTRFSAKEDCWRFGSINASSKQSEFQETEDAHERPEYSGSQGRGGLHYSLN